jgi:hypothetical protein
MAEQSDPFGQHRIVVLAARGIQFCPEGQQKLSGKSASLHLLKFAAQLDWRANKSFIGIADAVA